MLSGGLKLEETGATCKLVSFTPNVGPFDLTAGLALRTHSRYSAMKDTSNIVPVRILDSTWQTYKILNSLLVLILIYELSTTR